MPRVGYIYAMQARNGLVKIGWTSNPYKRLDSILTGSPTRLILRGFVEGTLTQERELHRLLKQWQAHREWFVPHGAVLDFLKILPRPKPLEIVDIIDVNRQRAAAQLAPKRHKRRDYFWELNHIRRPRKRG